jgi:hypothetical protein
VQRTPACLVVKLASAAPARGAARPSGTRDAWSSRAAPIGACSVADGDARHRLLAGIRGPGQDVAAHRARRSVKMTLPKRRRRPSSPARSTPYPSTLRYPGSGCASLRTGPGRRCPQGPGNCPRPPAEHVEIGDLTRRAMMRARSTRPSIPRPHWMFQVTSLIRE